MRLKKSQLQGIIATLSKKEVTQIRKMLRSPFFTLSESRSALFEVLLQAQRSSRAFPSPEQIFDRVFPGQKFDYARLRAEMSELLALIEEYWIIDHFRSDKVKSKLICSEKYRQRKLDKSFRSAVRRGGMLNESQPLRHADYHGKLLGFQMEKMKYQTSTKRSGADFFYQEISDAQDVLFLIQKLQTVCGLLSHQLVQNRSYDFGLLTPLLDKINCKKYLDIPAIAVYYYCFLFLTETKKDIYFQNFKRQLKEFRNLFSNEDLSSLYRLAINFCIRSSNEGQHIYRRELWELYKEGLSSEILLVNKQIPRFTFDNAVVSGLRLQQYTWVEHFIKEQSILLNTNSKDAAINFNMAKLEFERKNFNKALVHLSSSEFKDLMNQMVSKILLVKIFMELDADKALDAHLASFQQFIRRREVSEYHRKNILNLVKYVRKITSLPGYDRDRQNKLKKEILEESVLSEKDWLLEKLK